MLKLMSSIAFVTSRLDYCNGLFASCNTYMIRHLQRLQNTAACLVVNVPYSSLSQPLLRELHWLPTESRIKFKLCVFMSIPSTTMDDSSTMQVTGQVLH